ncbi:MAG: helix-turn-helix transcriptional regulator [Gammaproteobacteria bacterium]|nr:helix-turn-helix transcriptional regulator [Gammaproteobacteria bacterium]
MHDDPRLFFGLRLAQLRKRRGWSQERLALESGLARSYLGGVERGQRNLSLVNICRLADTLELPPSVLLEFDSVRRPSKRRR